jgi:hypothetical protein
MEKFHGRELYLSPNGDRWFLARDVVDGRAYIVHQPNLPSGGKRSQIDIATFLRDGGHGPEHHALLKLIGSLAEEISPTEASPNGS